VPQRPGPEDGSYSYAVDDGRRNLDVPVAGGELRGRIWDSGRGAPTVVAVHGITSNHLAWAKVADRLQPDVSLAATDLRGRVRSAALPGPWGIRRHADDVIAVLDHLALDRAVLAGHSMGAWVVLLTALRNPERVAGLVLVDGGVSLPAPVGLSTDEVLAAVLGPALERLATTYPSREAYLAGWAAHPAFSGGFDRATREHLLADLGASGFLWRSSVREDAVRADGAELLLDGEVRGALDEVLARGEIPVTLLRATRGLLDEPPPLIAEEAAAPHVTDPNVQMRTVEDTNHYSIILGDHGAAAVAEVVVAAVRASLDPTRSSLTDGTVTEAS
jgi:pimeloyl-ACP methyl ester carboxylesterase